MSQQILMSMIKLFMLFVIIIPSISIATACYTSIISFGDSLTDTGNFLHISSPNSPPQPASPPYGNTYFRTPTGRFSDGRIIVDFIAEYLGLPYVPPYFGSKVEDLKRGVNFAVGSATALDNSFFAEKGIYNPHNLRNISLGCQLALLRQLLPRLCSTTPRCRKFLGSSLVVMGEIGGNDYNIPFFAGHSRDEVREFVPLVVNKIGSVVKELIELGAKTILVPGNFPIGCSPSYLSTFNGTKKEDYDPITGCLNWFNNLSQYHNELLQNQLHHIQQLLPDATIIYADYYNAAVQLFHSPRKFGFIERDTLMACCGSGGTYNCNLSPSASCGTAFATCCDQPASRITWDCAHYTEAANRLISMAILDGSFSNPPFKSSLCGNGTYISTS